MATNSKKLSTANLMMMFGVGSMTIYNWRKGSSRITPLPFKTEPRGSRHSVYYILSHVKKWAKVNGIKMYSYPDVET